MQIFKRGLQYIVLCDKIHISEVKIMNKEVLNDLTYGMYVISTKYNGKDVGCFVNTVSQVTSEDVVISISMNKQNYTNEAIKSSKKFAVSILSTTSNKDVIGKFGFLTKFIQFYLLFCEWRKKLLLRL